MGTISPVFGSVIVVEVYGAVQPLDDVGEPHDELIEVFINDKERYISFHQCDVVMMGV